MSKRKSKDNTPIELIIPLLFGGIAAMDGNFGKAIKSFIVTLVIVCIISFSIRYLKAKKYRHKLLNSGMDIVDKMTGEEFEKFLLVHFERLGYKVELTPKTGDYGADLILKKECKIVVQAKRWTSRVGIEAIQQIIGAKEYYKADKCIVATNNYFTKNALNLADSSGVELWDRDKLIDIMNISSGREIAQGLTNNIDINSRHICPKCGNKMIFKNGKYGNFYGCSNYPRCKHTEKAN